MSLRWQRWVIWPVIGAAVGLAAARLSVSHDVEGKPPALVVTVRLPGVTVFRAVGPPEALRDSRARWTFGVAFVGLMAGVLTAAVARLTKRPSEPSPTNQ